MQPTRARIDLLRLVLHFRGYISPHYSFEINDSVYYVSKKRPIDREDHLLLERIC